MICHIIYEFCSLTRLQITETLETKAQSADVAVLMKALQSTLMFETKVQNDMKKQYSVFLTEAQKFFNDKKSDKSNNSSSFINLMVNGIEKQIKIEYVITSLPKYKGSISDSFEPYLKPYVRKEEEELRINILSSLNNDEIDYSCDLKVLNSSLYLFNYIRTVLKRAGQYSRSQTMFDIYQVIKRVLKLYIEEMFGRVQKEDKNRTKDENLYESTLCFIINTAEYCKDTIPGLTESIKINLDSPFCEKVELSNEEDGFVLLLNRTLETLLNSFELKMEIEFNNMLKLNWEKLDKVGDSSEYVKGVKNCLEKHVKNVKNQLSDVYFIFYLNKIVIMINNKFINNMYKCRRIGELGIQQLQLDIFEIKDALINLAKGENEKSSTSFNTFVTKTTQKSENILKLLAMNKEKFIENFRKFYEDASNIELEKILNLKGLKKNDVLILFK